MKQPDPIDSAELLRMLDESKAQKHTHMFLIVRSTGEYYSVGAGWRVPVREQYTSFVKTLPMDERVVGVYNHELDHTLQSTLKHVWLWDSEWEISARLDKSMYEAFLAWHRDVSEKARRKQLESDKNGRMARLQTITDSPYYGETGGGLTWKITYTSIGTVIKCKEAITHDEIDLTEYDSW